MKRRRVNADLKRLLMEKNVGAEASPSAVASAASNGVRGSIARGWVEQGVREHLLDCWHNVGARVTVFSVAEDGARFEQLAKENQVYAMWSADHDCGAWMTPQVCACAPVSPSRERSTLACYQSVRIFLSSTKICSTSATSWPQKVLSSWKIIP